jgi:hypothetical protein
MMMNETFLQELEILRRGGTWQYLWFVHPDSGQKHTYWFKGKLNFDLALKEARDNLKTDEVNVYFSINPTGQRGKSHHRSEHGTTRAVNAVNCYYAEFDEKDFGSKDEILEHIQKLEFQPSVIVDSGGGFHCRWFLEEPIKLIDEEVYKKVQARQRQWVEKVDGDPSAKCLSRVLRVPGTKNYKYDPAREVKYVGGLLWI